MSKRKWRLDSVTDYPGQSTRGMDILFGLGMLLILLLFLLSILSILMGERVDS